MEFLRINILSPILLNIFITDFDARRSEVVKFVADTQLKSIVTCRKGLKLHI